MDNFNFIYKDLYPSNIHFNISTRRLLQHSKYNVQKTVTLSILFFQIKYLDCFCDSFDPAACLRYDGAFLTRPESYSSSLNRPYIVKLSELSKGDFTNATRLSVYKLVKRLFRPSLKQVF